ncbi:MAG TPA: FHA domain-containing protein [Vicinamibacterales bacterium]|nr:FHA domain-containing protein [Vicinamibacterales bacterium]
MRYLFGNCYLDTESREFQRGGAQVHLSPKAYELLHLLIAQRPRVVSKAELMEALWPDTFVVEGNLPVLVAELRSAIGSRPTVAAAVIKTHHGIGYSFAVPVLASKSKLPPGQDGPDAVLTIGRRRIALGPGDNEIGRDPECDVHINDASVSRGHARITLAGTVATLVDHGSKNGTKVNGTLIGAPVELQDGDELTFGQVPAQYQIERRNSDSTLAL